jgi:predicted transcriptional regulator
MPAAGEGVGPMKTKERVLEYVKKKPMSTVEQITEGLGMNHGTVLTSVNTLKKRGKVKATHSWPAKYAVLPKKPMKGNDNRGFIDYVEELNKKYEEVKVENNRLRGELEEYRRKLSRLAQRIVRQQIYGKD